MQREIVAAALALLETADAARTTVQSPHAWWDVPEWRQRYARVDPAESEKLLAVGEQRRNRQAALAAADQK